MEGRESGGPSPEEMNFKSPENQPEDSGEAKAEDEPLVELLSSDVSKYRAGQFFDNGREKGTIEIIDSRRNAIFIRPEKQEKPEEAREPEGELTELFSSNVMKYEVGGTFDNGKVRGPIRRIDYTRSTIFVEEEKESGEGGK